MLMGTPVVYGKVCMHAWVGWMLAAVGPSIPWIAAPCSQGALLKHVMMLYLSQWDVEVCCATLVVVVSFCQYTS